MSTLSADRLHEIRKGLARVGLDGMLVTDPDNRFYVSGHLIDDHGPTESAGVALVGQYRALLLTSPNNVDWAASEAPEFEVRGWQRPWEQTVRTAFGELGWQRIGFERASISFATWAALVEPEGQYSLVPMDGWLDEIRWVKSCDEIDKLQVAIDITDRVFEIVEDQLRPGMSERTVAATIERGFLEHGADGAAFPATVGSGPNGARPHHRSGDRELREGEPIVIDIGAKLAGYCADLTRTVWIGALSDRASKIYSVVEDAQAAALKAVANGVPARVVDQATKTVFEGAEMSNYAIHAVGHGLGIRVHDGPSVNSASDRPLQTGNVVTIEPGLYVPGEFGVRIEDVVVVQENGYRQLSRARKRSMRNQVVEGVVAL
ncbi:aminopeptidase P family protein [soil metagenome]